jgi:hypothetical protein
MIQPAMMSLPLPWIPGFHLLPQSYCWSNDTLTQEALVNGVSNPGQVISSCVGHPQSHFWIAGVLLALIAILCTIAKLLHFEPISSDQERNRRHQRLSLRLVQTAFLLTELSLALLEIHLHNRQRWISLGVGLSLPLFSRITISLGNRWKRTNISADEFTMHHCTCLQLAILFPPRSNLSVSVGVLYILGSLAWQHGAEYYLPGSSWREIGDHYNVIDEKQDMNTLSNGAKRKINIVIVDLILILFSQILSFD